MVRTHTAPPAHNSHHFIEALETAADNNAFLAATGAMEWRRKRPGQDAPASMLPDEHSLSACLDSMPADARRLADQRLTELMAPAIAEHFLELSRTAAQAPAQWTALAREDGAMELWTMTAAGIKPLSAVIAEWKTLQAAGAGPVPNPLGALVAAWQDMPRGIDHARIDMVQDSRARVQASKVPALHHAAAQVPLIAGELVTVAMDGEPFASTGPLPMRRYRRQRPPPGQMDVLPATLDGRATGDMVLSALADTPLTGMQYRTLRGDLRGFGELVFALGGTLEISAADLIRLSGWSGDPAEQIPRLGRLLQLARFLSADLGDGLPHWLFRLEKENELTGLDALYSIGAGKWWQAGSKAGSSNAWRLSGGLWRPTASSYRHGLPVGYWGTAMRAVAGIEAALSWSATAGKGRKGRIPDLLRPLRRGGPGPERFIEHWRVLRYAGEPVTAESYRTSSGQRMKYNRLIESLNALQYVCPTPSRPAPAAGTIEITRIVKGGRGHPGGIMVRATTRFCEAYARGQGGEANWTSVPVAHVLQRRVSK